MGGLVSCASPGADSSRPGLAEEARQVFATGEGTGVSGVDGNADEGWTIVLAAFRGEGHAEAAARAVRQIRTEGGLPEAVVQQRSAEASIIAYGRFAGPDSPEAREQIDRIHSLVVRGRRPFAAAFLAPPTIERARGNLAQYDLRNARRLYGRRDRYGMESAALYTLQIGVYSREDRPPNAEELATIRAAAEQAVSELRRQGELAFFYHGPTRSMVTIGVFGVADRDPSRPGFESSALRSARERFPYNLLNGKGIGESLPGGGSRLQRSALVNIPE